MKHVFEGSLSEVEREAMGRRIVELRHQFRISQSTIARRTKSYQSKISAAEHGVVRSRAVYERILNAISDIVAERATEDHQRYIASLRQTASLGVPA